MRPLGWLLSGGKQKKMDRQAKSSEHCWEERETVSLPWKMEAVRHKVNHGNVTRFSGSTSAKHTQRDRKRRLCALVFTAPPVVAATTGTKSTRRCSQHALLRASHQNKLKFSSSQTSGHTLTPTRLSYSSARPSQGLPAPSKNHKCALPPRACNQAVGGAMTMNSKGRGP